MPDAVDFSIAVCLCVCVCRLFISFQRVQQMHVVVNLCNIVLYMFSATL